MSASTSSQTNQLEKYYQFHAKVYDATRWSFLFGRKGIIQRVANLTTPTRILEVGCGTGKNLVELVRHFPEADITGLDLSADMLNVTRRNLANSPKEVKLLHQAYDKPLNPPQPYDLILFSYALTMFNPGWSEAIEYAHEDLATGGFIAIADFHASPVKPFRQWMGVNHVRMEGHLLPKLETTFTPRLREVKAAYGGLWQYLMFIGEKT